MCGPQVKRPVQPQPEPWRTYRAFDYDTHTIHIDVNTMISGRSSSSSSSSSSNSSSSSSRSSAGQRSRFINGAAVETGCSDLYGVMY